MELEYFDSTRPIKHVLAKKARTPSAPEASALPARCASAPAAPDAAPLAETGLRTLPAARAPAPPVTSPLQRLSPSQNVVAKQQSRPPQINSMPNPTATFTVSGGVSGTFKAEIFLDRVPITASNFIDLSQSGFYNGIHFHRVIPGFMDQFGCPNARDPKSRAAGQGGPFDGTFKNLKTGGTETRSNGGNIKDENISKDTNAPGTLSMANTGRPNSGGSQFFLNVNSNANLDWFSGGSSKHPVFGKVTENYDLLVQISKAPTRDDNPVNPIKMESIVISM